MAYNTLRTGDSLTGRQVGDTQGLYPLSTTGTCARDNLACTLAAAEATVALVAMETMAARVVDNKEGRTEAKRAEAGAAVKRVEAVEALAGVATMEVPRRSIRCSHTGRT